MGRSMRLLPAWNQCKMLTEWKFFLLFNYFDVRDRGCDGLVVFRSRVMRSLVANAAVQANENTMG